jgi:hypothetical protein
VEVKPPPPPLNFHPPGLADESYVIFVGGRQKLCNFCLVTFIGQGLTEDKMKPMKKLFFRGFWLIFHRSMEDQKYALTLPLQHSCPEISIPYNYVTIPLIYLDTF